MLTPQVVVIAAEHERDGSLAVGGRDEHPSPGSRCSCRVGSIASAAPQSAAGVSTNAAARRTPSVRTTRTWLPSREVNHGPARRRRSSLLGEHDAGRPEHRYERSRSGDHRLSMRRTRIAYDDRFAAMSTPFFPQSRDHVAHASRRDRVPLVQLDVSDFHEWREANSVVNDANRASRA